ncbi:MAG TPA: BamA/TamA family outer membrane protein [Polyangiaceae bacterium]|nr:BamA/TamA family outer membrane protein [Polyangiaceae bacterium]
MGRSRRLSFELWLGVSALASSALAQRTDPAPSELGLDAPSKKPSNERAAPASDEPANVIVPLLMYTPETHVGFGGLFVHFFRPPPDSKQRVSSFAFFAIGTTRRQAILEAHPDFYAYSGALHLFGKVEYQYFPDSFWGVGPHTQDEDEERYTRSRFRAKASAHYRLVGPLNAGLAADVMDYHATYAEDGIFASETFIGEEGGVTSGFGPSALYDTRDSTVNAHSGTLLSATLLLFNDPLSAYTFRKFVLEARQFFDLGNNHALGARFYGEIQGGEVPYYHLAMLGGDEMLRGYYYGRYRDETLAAVEAEYRYPIYWRFSGVAFAGAGGVAPTVSDLLHEPVRWAVGGGGRFSLSDSERLNLRLDAGFGIGTWGVYFTAREAF